MHRALWVVAGLAALAARSGEEVCRHPARGASRPVSLDAVRRAHAEGAAFFARWAGTAAELPRGSFDSGLPACAARGTRSVRTRVPLALVGRTIAVAPEGRFPKADVRLASRAGSLIGLEADGLAHRELAERLGVRCAPTLVRVRSEVELELVEDP